MKFSPGSLLIVAAVLSSGGRVSAEISFNEDIRPILSNTCFACHGPDEAERKAGLRLDTREGAMEDRDGIQAIVPGDLEASELIYRITADDEDDLMPPRKFGKPLTPEQIETVRRWVAEGAPYERHWAYAKPMQPEVPVTKTGEWSRTPVDAFVLERLEKEGLRPSAEADRQVLGRRVALDLTGLPLTPEEAAAFAADTDPDAYRKLVRDLVNRPSFGEHWARMWLDLARYADSAGYADDPPREIWSYRDYVIRSFNANKPFDQFTREQLAGDLLPDPSEEQLIATAFHRNTQTNNEGGTNDEEYRNVAVVDRVNTTGQVWLGTTLACAQCHTHKYDPITQEEYFEIFAILNQTEDSDRRDEAPVLRIYSEEESRKRADLEQQITRLEAELEKEAAASKGPERTGPVPVRFLRVQAVGKGVFLHLAEVEVLEGPRNIAPEGSATQSSTAYDGPASLAIDGNRDGDYGAQSVSHTGREDNPWIEVDLGSERNLARVQVWNRTDNNTGDRLKKFRFIAMDRDRNPVWVRMIAETPKPSAGAELPASFEDFSNRDLANLDAYLAEASPQVKRIAQLRKQLNGMKGVTTPIMSELPQDKRRTTHIQLRGSFLDKDKEVAPGVPEELHPWPEGLTRDRLGLAEWILDPANPLTARVVVNRFWEKIFGIGLVETSEEFGSQGEPPSHPELLDWLAAEFVASGWDVKRLLELLVNSAAYRQDSHVTAEMAERDPSNRLLARGPRFRLTAEMLRDQSLYVAGLLSSRMYGPPVNPPQPELGLKAAFGGGIDWKTSTGEDRYRRGIYTRWRRSSPYPSMAAFDAPNREVCTVRRDRTNTPLQAFVTLNDPVFVEAAQGLARRMAGAGDIAPEKVRRGYELCLGRGPDGKDEQRLLQLYDRARAAFEGAPDDARLMATEPLGPLPEGSDPVDLAALTVVGNVLLNLDEMLMKR